MAHPFGMEIWRSILKGSTMSWRASLLVAALALPVPAFAGLKKGEPPSLSGAQVKAILSAPKSRSLFKDPESGRSFRALAVINLETFCSLCRGGESIQEDEIFALQEFADETGYAYRARLRGTLNTSLLRVAYDGTSDVCLFSLDEFDETAADSAASAAEEKKVS
jgi:hypothetical protein